MQSEILTVQKFFEGVKKIQIHNGQAYEIYKDFIFSNYDLLILFEEIYKNPNSLDLKPIHRLFVDNNFKSKIELRGVTAFSLFSEDI